MRKGGRRAGESLERRNNRFKSWCSGTEILSLFSCHPCLEWPCHMKIPHILRNGSRHFVSWMAAACIVSDVLLFLAVLFVDLNIITLVQCTWWVKKNPALSPSRLFLNITGCSFVFSYCYCATRSASKSLSVGLLCQSLGLRKWRTCFWHGWMLFQVLLLVLNHCSRKHCWDNLKFGVRQADFWPCDH